jgi:two-component sensor histidine kinase
MFGGPNSERILILAPRGRDAEIASKLLQEAGRVSLACADVPELCVELGKGAGLAVISEETIATSDLGDLMGWIKAQPPWSDFPIVLLTTRGDAPERNALAQRFQDILGNVSFLERPFHPTTLVSASNAALRSRRRQYQARELLERYELLARELQHRSKNLLTIIKSIARASLPNDEGRDAFFSRVLALAKAQDLIMEGDIRGAAMKEVVDQAVASFGDRVSVEGPHVFLNASAAQGFALIMHELATNATKHGSLTSNTGTVAVRWWLDTSPAEPAVVFQWQERGGPSATPPMHTGFGSVLLKHALANSGCPPRFDYAPEGFTYELKAVHVWPPTQDNWKSGAGEVDAT